MLPTIRRKLFPLFTFVGMTIAAPAFADFNYEYYEGTWNNLPNFSALTPVQTGTVTTFDISPRLQDDNFGFRFTGQITVDFAGVYGFSTNSDDGSHLSIDGQLVVDNDGLHGPVRIEGYQFLSTGTHTIEVTFFEKGGGQVLDVQYSPPGGGFRSIPSSGVLDGPDSPAEKGVWGPVIQWPHVPVSAANLPDGRVLTWASNERYSFPGSVGDEFTFTAVWDPATSLINEIDRAGHDMFCSHQVMLEDGKVFVAGGRNQDQTPFTSVFDATTDQWVPLTDMQRGRWYPTAVALADGSVMNTIGSGGSNTAEIYRPDTGQWELLTGLDFNPMILNYSSSQYGERNWWPLLHLAPDGRIFHAGPTPQMHFIDTAGVGSANAVGSEFTDWYPKHGTIVMYDEGKLISAGGWVQGTSIVSTNEAMTIDISGPVPVVTTIAPMLSARKFQNGVMLPNGEMLVVGGNTSGQKFNDTGSVLQAEIWNPANGQWRWAAAMSVPRNYHSIALLLPDATVISAGGGLCNCSADHADGQVYEPPYLFNPDGSTAVRPSIVTAPAAIRSGDQFNITTNEDISHFSMVKMSSTTHAVNTDLRYLSVTYSGAAGNYQLNAHANPNVLTPGYWMLFALNAQGTPSVAHVVQVKALNAGDPPAQPSIDFSFDSLADLSAFQVNPSASGVGGALRLTDGGGQAGSGFYRTPIILGTDTSFNTQIQFRIDGTGDGGDGMAFVLQGNDSTALGAGGQGLGYEGVINSLAIELDTDSDAVGDTNDNHIAVHMAGDVDVPLGTVLAPFDLEDSNPHLLWISYDGGTNVLDIYLAENVTDDKPASPILSVTNIDLPATVGSQGYFGFTAGTSGLSNNHDVEAWALAVGAGGEPLVLDPVFPSPQPGDGPVNFSASATGTGLDYRWSFGDGSPQTAWSSDPNISHLYSNPGRYFVTLTVRDVNGNEDSLQFVQAVYPPVTVAQPRSSNGILFESVTSNDRVWNVNPDNDTVTVIDASMNLKLAEIPVGGDPRTLALAPDGRIWVVNKDSATISIIGTVSLVVEETRQLAAASRPHGVAIDDVGGNAFVTLEALGRVLKLDVYSDTELANLDVGADPRHLSLTADRSTLYLTRFITPMLPGEDTTSPVTVDGFGDPVGGEVLVIDTATMAWNDTVVLEHSFDQPSEQTGPGLPNYLGPAVIAPSGLNAWVASKQDNVLRGSQRSGNHLDHDHSVRAVTSVFDIATGIENLGGRVDHDNASVASNGAFGIYGVYLFIPLEGNREVAVIDVFANEELLRFDVGFAPQAVVVSADGNTLYVHNFIDRSVTVADISELINGISETVTIDATISTAASEALSPDVLLGKRHFYDARDTRITQDSYMSCASCHHDGSHDGRIWDFKGFGEGLRNTISLEGHAGVGQGRLHWSANFDEVHDFENQIRGFNLGSGFMTEPDFTATQGTLDAPKAGLSADLDALSVYVSSLASFGASPHRDPGGLLTAEGAAGKLVFEAANCATCHTGSGYTDSANDTVFLHDVGTLKTSSGERMGGTLDGIDTPTLKGLWLTAPYLHDGSAATVRAAIEAHDPAVFGGVSLTSQDLDSLAAYMLQIDDQEIANTVPLLAPIGAPSVVENDTLTIFLAASDADGHGLTLSQAGLPGFATLTDNGNGTGTIDVVPLGGDAGTYPVTVTATDNGPGSLAASQSFDLVVSDGIQPPVLNPIGNQSVTEGLSLTFTATATDIDGDVLSFTESDLPGFASFTDNGDGTATVDVTPPGGAAGTYPVTITVTDDSAGALTDSETFDLAVVNNQPPTLATIGTQSVIEGGSLTINLGASDGDGDGLGFSESGLPGFATFTDNGDGTATITVAPNFGDAVGSPYPVTVTVTDDGIGALFDDETFNLQVTDGNEPPVLATIGNQVVVEGGSLNIGLSATDGDGDGLVLGHSGLPGFASFTDNGDGTGSIGVLPGFGDSGGSPYSITVTVTDNGSGALTDNETFDLTVQDGNEPPDLTPIGSQLMAEDGLLTVNLAASDNDGDNLVLSHLGLPGFASFTDNGDGTGTIDFAPQAGDAGDYTIEVFVDDDGTPSLGDSESFDLSVSPAGLTLFQQDGTGLLVMEAENFDANVGGNGVAPWSVISEPGASNGEAIKSPLGLFTGVPDTSRSEYNANFAVAGTHHVWVRFRAFNGGSDSMYVEVDTLGVQQLNPGPVTGNWEWAQLVYDTPVGIGAHAVKLYRREKELEIDRIVLTTDGSYVPAGLGPAESPRAGPGENTPPTLAPISNQSMAEDGLLTVNLAASDNDGDNLVLSHLGLPGFASFTDNGDGTGTIDFAPLAGDAGDYTIEVFVDDDGTPSLGDSESFDLSVSPAGLTLFQQDGTGLLVMEAENFDANVGGNGVAPWSVISEPGASNGEAIKSPLGLFTGVPDTSRSEYNANFAVAGTHHVWVRFRAFNGGSDSMYVEVDTLGVQQLNPGPVTGNWEWAQLVYDTPVGIGAHAVKLYRREKELEIDRIVLTTDGSYVPAGLGPAESPRAGPGENTPPTLAPISNQSMAEDGLLTVNLAASDNDGDNLVLSHLGLPGFASFTDNGDGTGTIDFAPQAGDAGDYTIEVFVDDDGTPSLGDSESFDLSVSPAGLTLFQQDGTGLLVMEAENFDANVGGNGVAPWSVISEPGASNGEAIKSPLGLFTGVPDTSRSEYNANFAVAGTHHVWVRFRAFNGGSDSMYVEVDTLGVQQLNPGPVTGNWEWAQLVYDTPVGIGAHAVKLYRREKELEIDRIVLTTDGSYVPAGLGPAESLRQ